ncbi:MAG TPA: PucR family transcriptional regulator [Candidatus Angelobacter sp.]|nr:PucR family transcriptional regulator [Candidatus Angelobacter sp.]
MVAGEPGAGDGREPRAPGVTLADLLALPEFRLTCVAGADGLDRVVRWVHTTELLDPSQYLRGGELVCTVGTSLDEGPECARFVSAVATAGGSGICFGVGDVHDAVPPQLVRACEEHGLPLLLAPLGVPFMTISEYLVQSRVRAESAAGERGARLLVDLLARVRAQAPPEELVALAAARLGGRLVLSEGERVLASSGSPDPAGADLVSVVADSPDGATLTWTGAGAAPSSTLVATLAHVLDVARHEVDVEQDLQRERIGQLLTLVGDRLASPSAFTQVLADAGLPSTGLVFSVWPPGASRVLASTLVGVPVVFGEMPSGTVAITAAADPVRAASDQLGLVCGLSRGVPLTDSARGIGEARAAFEMARRDGGCVGPEGLTSLDGLLRQQPPDRLRPFVDQLLGPLLASDARRGTAYVSTLSTYLRSDGSLAATARAEFLHVNTVRHRLERVRQLTGRDPVVFDDRVALAIALWAHENLDARRA